MNAESNVDYAPGDPVLIKNIVSQLKSQGVFDQFRKECISDVDTKPAYQNLCHRVDGQVESYLSKVKWEPDLNKNQLRENIRKYVNECPFVEPGIARIVDQLVNPRINTVLVPKVEDIVYNYLGIERPSTEEAVKNNGSSYDSHLSQRTGCYWNTDDKINELQTEISTTKKSRKSETAKFQYQENLKQNITNFQSDESNSTADRGEVLNEYDCLISQSNVKTETIDENKLFNFESRTDNKLESSTSLVTDHGSTLKHETLDSCSNIDSDEDDLSPPFELLVKSDNNHTKSDYKPDVLDSKDVKITEANISYANAENDKLYRNLECICGEGNMDSASSHSYHAIENEKCSRKLSSVSELPKTPTIIYETSDDSEDNCRKKSNSENSRRDSTDPGYEPSETKIKDTSNSLTQRIAEDIKEVASTHKVSTDDGGASMINSNIVDESALNVTKKNDDGEIKHNKSKEHSSDSKSKNLKNRDRKHSDHRKEKDRSKSDRHHSSKNREHKSSRSRDQLSENGKSENSKDGKRRDQKDGVRNELDKKDRIQKSHNDETKLKDRGSKNTSSSKSTSNSDKHKMSSHSKSNESKDDKKKKISSKHDSNKEKESNRITIEKSKSKKEDSSDVKKSKSQCNTDEKKARTDRRSSDRDSNGPSSASSQHSVHRSSSKTDKEKHVNRSKHSSSVSSHKSKKNVDLSSSQPSDVLTFSVGLECEINGKSGSLDSKLHNIEKNILKQEKLNEISNHEKPAVFEKQLYILAEDLRNSEKFIPFEKTTNNDTNETVFNKVEVSEGEKDKSLNNKVKTELENNDNSKLVGINKRKFSESSVANAKTETNKISMIKSKSLDCDEGSIKKPKIAKNASDIFRIMELRKQYKERVRVLQQQGKENTNSEVIKEMLPLDREDKTVLGKLSPVNTIALKESFDNYISKALGQNNTNVGKEEQLANSVIDTVGDVKLKIRRIDSCYELVNGSCVVSENNTDTKILLDSDSLTGVNNNNYSNISNNNIKDARTECCNETLMFPTTTETDPNQNGAISIDNFRSDSKSSENEHECQSTEKIGNVIDAKSVEYNVLQCKAAVVEGDLDRIEQEKHVTGDDVGIQKFSSSCDTVEYSARFSDSCTAVSVNTEHSDHTCSSSEDGIDEVHYFEPPELKTSFINFVARRIKESEELYLQNFSINIKCPEKHDNIFRNQLGAIVRRKGRSDLLPSPVKYNSEIISNKPGDEKGIMLRIKKSINTDLSPSSKETCKRNSLDSVTENDLPALSVDTANSSVSCESSIADTEECSMSSEISIPNVNGDNLITADETAEKTKKVSGVKSKRKTLGIKRKLLYTPKSNNNLKSNCSVLSNELGNHATSKVLRTYRSSNHDRLEQMENGLDNMLNDNTNERLTVTEDSRRNNGNLFHSTTVPKDQNEKNNDKKVEKSSNDDSSSVSQGLVTMKNQKRMPVQKQSWNQISKESDKRKQFYYDEGDLYKPRLSFLLSSRRCRSLNTENTKELN